MRNPSKKTIKTIARNAYRSKEKDFFYDCPPESHLVKSTNTYFLWNQVGARLYIMSKGKICNRGVFGLEKYFRQG